MWMTRHYMWMIHEYVTVCVTHSYECHECVWGKACVLLSAFAHSHAHAHMHTHIYMHVHARAHTHTHSHAHLQPQQLWLIHVCDMMHSHGRHDNTLLHTATHCNTLQHTATHFCTLQHTLTSFVCGSWLKHTATHRNTLQHTAIRCNTLQHTATHCNTLQHTATHCNTLQHTATHCNTRIPHLYMRRDSNTRTPSTMGATALCVTCLICVCDMMCDMSYLRVCDMTCDMSYLRVWHDVWHVLFACVTWPICVCDKTHVCAWHDPNTRTPSTMAAAPLQISAACKNALRVCVCVCVCDSGALICMCDIWHFHKSVTCTTTGKSNGGAMVSRID